MTVDKETIWCLKRCWRGTDHDETHPIDSPVASAQVPQGTRSKRWLSQSIGLSSADWPQGQRLVTAWVSFFVASFVDNGRDRALDHKFLTFDSSRARSIVLMMPLSVEMRTSSIKSRFDSALKRTHETNRKTKIQVLISSPSILVVPDVLQIKT